MKQNQGLSTSSESGPDLLPIAPATEHLFLLENQEWAFWRTVALRSAGFPAHEVLKLAMPASTAAADQLIQAEKDILPQTENRQAILRDLFQAEMLRIS